VCTEPREKHLPSSPGIWRQMWISNFENQKLIDYLGSCSKTGSGTGGV
jgi:hypothetical protein